MFRVSFIRCTVNPLVPTGGLFSSRSRSVVHSDLAIARSVTPLPIATIATEAGIFPDELRLYGETKAKVKLSLLKRLDRHHETEGAPLTSPKRGKYVVVAGMSPTPLGEGKSTTVIGLAQALGAHLGKKSIACIRQPSQGPTFGLKGGAAGGGYSQVIPMDEFNLHGTGDIHALTAANNLLAAAIDTRIFQEHQLSDESLYMRLTNNLTDFAPPMLRRLQKMGINKTHPKELTSDEKLRFSRLNIDPNTITWRRVTDVNDRFLRQVTIGQGEAEKGLTRVTGWDIAVASECMAILALASDLSDLRRRLGAIVVAKSTVGGPITAEDMGCAGAMAALMKDTVEPTLMQTLEHTPVFVHAGPFGNIAHGNSSVIADQMALRLVGEGGFVLTEAGFGADMGCEKFFNIKCRASGLKPDAAIVVGTVRALKYHGGLSTSEACHEDLQALAKGAENLERHIRNMQKFGVPCVVVLNRFESDTDKELAMAKDILSNAGAFDVTVSDHWALGGKGAVDAAKALIRCTDETAANFSPLYADEAPLKEKIEVICKEIYGADGCEFNPTAKADLADFEARGYGGFPICMAKTQYSFSHDPLLRGAPTGFTVPVRGVKVSVGAGFVFPLLGDIATMPGLPARPAYYNVDIDEDTGDVIGLS